MAHDGKHDGDGFQPPVSGCRSNWKRRWELKRLHEMGLEDVEWHAEEYCPYCIQERLARERENE